MITKRQVAWGMGIAVAISILLHLPFLNLPPYSQHTWRQCTTLTVAENFYEEDMNIFLPRVNQRYEGNGITGSEFPLYEWLIAATYQVTGKAWWVHRIWSFLWTVLGAWAIAQISRRWWKSQASALLAFVFYLFSPELFYDGWIALPDPMALALVLTGFYYFDRWWETRKDRLLIPSAFFFILGGTIKLQYLGIGFLVLGMIVRDWKNLHLRIWLRLILFGGLVALIPIQWYRYSATLIQMNGLYDFGLDTKPAENLSQLLYVLKKNLLSDLPELLLGYVGTAGFLFLGFLFLRKGAGHRHPLFWPFLFFVLGFWGYHLMEIQVLEHHQYYMLPYLILLVPVAARGIDLLARNQWKFLGLFLGLQIILATARILPSRFANDDKMIPDAFWNTESREALRRAVPDDALIMTGPDESITINLFFLHKKGWGYNNKSMIMDTLYGSGKPNIEDAINRGCKYLITSDSHQDLMDLGVQPYLKDQIYYTDGFSVYALKPREE
ncbi:MAG: phospholipid carrier-dependent glycosyltransferase [Bacteroidetes bacterium]|nr:phospholipid carrier-dependent glycosyltransferase [Bacteroidota bacterium]